MKISDIPHQTYSSGNIRDFALQLKKAGIKKIVNMIYEAYVKLEISKIVTEDMDEVRITEELFIKIQRVWREKGDQNIIPISEKPHDRPAHSRGRSPTIDFCFRDEYCSNAYFGSECKKLKENDSPRYSEYIQNGVCRYIRGKYSVECSEGSMIGYIVKGDAERIITGVVAKVDEISDYSKTKQSDMIKDFSAYYISGHTRSVGVSPIQIHHFFFVFTVAAES